MAGKRLSRMRLAPQLAAPPMTPPAIARPTNAPATTIGAIFGLGEEENEGSTEIVFILMNGVVMLYTDACISLQHKIFLDLKLRIESAVSATLIQIIPLLLTGADATGARGIVARAALGFDLILSKNEKFAGGQRNGTALVELSRLGVVLIAHLTSIVARSVFPVGDGESTVHAVIQGSTVVIGPQHDILLSKSLLNCTSNIGGHASHGKRSATAEQVGS